MASRLDPPKKPGKPARPNVETIAGRKIEFVWDEDKKRWVEKR